MTLFYKTKNFCASNFSNDIDEIVNIIISTCTPNGKNNEYEKIKMKIKEEINEIVMEMKNVGEEATVRIIKYNEYYDRLNGEGFNYL